KPRVFLRKVRIEIPVGEGESDLTTVGGAQAIQPSAAGGGPGGWAYKGQGTGAPSGKAWFDFGPNNADPFTGFGLVLTLPSVKINDVASTSQLQIKVTVYTSSAANTPEPEWTPSTDIPSGVYKFPENFVFSGLRVEEVMIPYNTSGTLRWESQAANCTVVYKTKDGEEKRIDVGDAKEWPTPHLTTYTNFRVEARSVEGQNTRIYALNTTALVDTPDLNLHTLNVNGATDLRGNTQTRHLTCVEDHSIRTKHLRGPAVGDDRVLMIDKDSTGVTINGNTEFIRDSVFDGHINQAENKTLRTANIRPVVGENKTLTIGSSDAGESGNNVVVNHDLTVVNGKRLKAKDIVSPSENNWIKFYNSIETTGSLSTNGDLTVGGDHSIRTKHLRGPSTGDRTLIIDADKKGTEFPGPVKLLSAVRKTSLPQSWVSPLPYDRLYFGNSGDEKFYIDIAMPGGFPTWTVQVDAWRGFSFVVPAGWQYRRRGGLSGDRNAYSVNFGQL
ncbi:hypothetical protein ACWCZ5_34560, partial [Streptomyces sp. NPDC001667]